MEIQKIQNDKQKLVITYLIVSDKLIQDLYPILQEHKNIIFQSFTGFYRIVLEWCLNYYEKYHKAPNIHIQNIYNEKKQQLKEEDQKLLETFLQNLSDKYEEQNYNEKYILDLSLTYLREINLNVLQKQIDEFKTLNRIDDAEHLVLTYNKFDTQTEIKQETFLFKDLEYACKVCDNSLNTDEDDKLFKLKGDLGDKLGWIYREDFFSLVAPAKRGKSFYLREIALICAEQGLNVIVFNLEESHKKYCKSFYQNISSEIKDKPESFKNIKIPYFEKNANDKYDIKYEELKKFGLNSRKIRGVFNKQKIKTKGDIIVRSFPSNTLTFQKMSKCLDEYALQGYVVDVLLIDFLDNLKSFNKSEHRHSIDEKWTNTRRLAQEKHIAIGTVSHTKKENFKKDIEMGSPNEDYRKENHITQMIGINQTPEEKKKQVARLNIFHNRENDCNSKEFFVCLECRDLGKVLVDNMNLYKVNYGIKKEK